MASVVDPHSGLHFFELSHIWGHGTPSMPGHEDVSLKRGVKHAEHGVMTHRTRMVMHSSTHLNSPIHLIQNGEGVGELDIQKCFGVGAVIFVPKKKWELVTVSDLNSATPKVRSGDIVIIVTGWHTKYSDSLEYFGESPGLWIEAAEWLVEKGVKLVGVDTPQVDHPLATSLGPHRGGPLMKRLPKKYEDETGRDPKIDFPVWNGAHKLLLQAGIPTIENVGGDVAELAGKQALIHAYPWKWIEGDASVIRLVGILDPGGDYRIEPGNG